jgi:polysulfide reductase chain C
MPNSTFSAAPRAQQAWSWLLATWLFLGGTGSGLFLVFIAFGLNREFAVVALALVLTGGVVLLLELGNPLRVWRTIFRPATSWLSRGVFFVICFIISATLLLAPALDLLTGTWIGDEPFQKVLISIAGICAFMIILYPAFFFLSTSRAIPFWNTWLLPLLFVSYALLGGDAIVLLLSPAAADVAARADLAAVILNIANAILTVWYLVTMEARGGSARESVRILNRAPLAWLAWFCVGGIGMLLPLVAIPLAWPMAAGLCILIGGFFFRFCLLKAGVYASSALAEEAPSLVRLNRTNADLEKEYAIVTVQRAGRTG